MNRTKNAWINGLFFILTLIINTLGATGVINNLNQKQISDMYLTLITPSPATFSIWSVIYSLLLATVIAMIVKQKDTYYQRATDELSMLFRLSCLLNALWIVAFSFVLLELSVILILAFVISLSLLGLKLLKIHEKKRWLLPLTFGLYTGWLVIATTVNISSALVKLGWNGFGLANDTWAVIILIVAVLLMAGILLKIKNAAFPLPVAWAYWGIYQFNISPIGFNGQYGLLQTTALIGIAVLVALAVLQFIRNQYGLLPAPSKKR